MEPVGVLARCRLFLGRTHVVIAIVDLLLIYYLGLTKDESGDEFKTLGIAYLALEISSHAHPHSSRLLTLITAADQERELAVKLFGYFHLSVVRLVLLVGPSGQQFSIFHSFSFYDGWEQLCASVLQACRWVMVLLNCFEIIIDCLMYVDPSRIGAIAVPVGNGDVRVPLGLLDHFGGVLIWFGRFLGGVDGLVAWRLGLGTMGAALLTLVLGAFGSVMTTTVLWTCVGLGFLETILVCASRQKMLDMCVRVRYVIISGFKIGPVIFSIVIDNLHSLTESNGCEMGSACYSRLRECFWVMLVFYILEVFLALLLLFVHHPRQEIQIMENHVLANIYGLILNVSNFFGVILSVSSALSMTQITIVGLLLGGSFGPLMTAKGFWLCGSILFVEMAALMGVTDWVANVIQSQFDLRMSASKTKSAFIMVPALRICGLVIINILLLDARNHGEKFFITNMSNCDETCKARGRDLLVICTGTVIIVQFFLSFFFFSLTIMFPLVNLILYQRVRNLDARSI